MRSNLSSPDKKVERYFKTLSSNLSALPKRKREEVVQEIRQHFDDLVADHEALGASKANATDTALEQMGRPTRLADDLRRQWHLSLPSIVHAAYALFFAFGVYGYAVIGTDTILYLLSIYLNSLYLLLMNPLSLAVMVAPPICGGLTVGWMYPKYNWRLMLCVTVFWISTIALGSPGQTLLAHSYWEEIISPTVSLGISLISASVAARASQAIIRRMPAWIRVSRFVP